MNSIKNWYTNNICNQTKLNTWNKETLQRNFPDSKMPPVFDPRPSFRRDGNTYFVQPSGPIDDSKKNQIFTNPTEPMTPNYNFPQNLDPFRKDRDCFFNTLTTTLNPGQPNQIEFIKRIDVDSFNRGLTQILTKSPTELTNPYCVFPEMCQPQAFPVQNTPPRVVQIINNWNAPLAQFQLPYTTNLIQTPHFYNGCPGIPIENSFNNHTKQLDQAPVDVRTLPNPFLIARLNRLQNPIK